VIPFIDQVIQLERKQTMSGTQKSAIEAASFKQNTSEF